MDICRFRYFDIKPERSKLLSSRVNSLIIKEALDKALNEVLYLNGDK